MSTEEDYKKARIDLSKLIECAFELSMRLNKLSGDTRKQIASVLFAKLNLCALSISKLLPNNAAILEQTEHLNPDNFCDISSVASLCRNLIEASNRLFYFGVESAPESEIRMRLKIHELHAVRGHREILRLVKYDPKRIEEFDAEIDALRSEIEKFEEFGLLKDSTKKRILHGWQAEALSQSAIAKSRGIDEPQFRADYKYLSSHIHSDAYAVFDLQLDNKVRGPMTEAIRERLVALTRESTRYLAMTIRDMNTLFPQFELSDAARKKLQGLIDGK